jgi:hypothetical protein
LDIVNFFDSLTGPVITVSIAIVLGAVLFWFRWNPRIKAVALELRNLQKGLDSSEIKGRQAITTAIEQTKDANVRNALREIQSGLFELPGDLGVKTYSLRFYQDILTPRVLLAKKVNLALYEAAPNILIGVGLLFTFGFLAIALADVMPALGPSAAPENIRSAISGLLQNASGKFLTSIAGMSCSLFWSYASKRNLENLEDEIEALCSAMQMHVEDTGSEAAISAQIALLSEILNENREQVGQLKRFETDFAVAIGKALGSQMQPAFERLAATISDALRALTEKVGTMNEEALRKMLSDFKNAITEHSGEEMEAFKRTLIEISEQIKTAAQKLEGAGGEAGAAIKAGGKELTDALTGGAGDLRQAAGLLEQAMVTAKATVNDMDATLEKALEQGKSGFEQLQAILLKLSSTAADVGTLVNTIQNVSADFKDSANAVSDTTSNLEKVVVEQSNIVSSVSNTANTLGVALTSANQEFRTSAQAMTDTTKEMTAGVEAYSQQLVTLHANLDENLAKAIGSLNSTVSELIDGLDDFLEEVRKGRN